MLTNFSRHILVLTSIFASCEQSSKFNSDDWQRTSDPGLHPHRERMVNDLIMNHHLKGLHYHVLIQKLGQPDFWEPENKTFYYGLAVNYSVDLDPTGQRALQFKFSSDSLITDFEILEATQ